MTPLAAHADQAVRHAVDAYIDGRFLPTFEGQAAFETRNSRYRLLDGVLLAAPDPSLVGAELVGWLVEYPSRSEVTPTWKNGARAVLVDTRNDGIRGPHIVVTSATRSFRTDRDRQSSPRMGSSPRDVRQAPLHDIRQSLPQPVPAPVTGSRWTQGGSSMDQAWAQYPAPVAPPAPVSPSWGHYPPPAPVAASHHETSAQVKTLPPPPLVPAFGGHAEMAEPAIPRPAPVPAPAPPAMMMRPATPPPPPPRPLPRPLPPPPAYADGSMARRIEAAIDACGTAIEMDDAMPTARDEHRRGTSRFAEGAVSGTRSRVASDGRSRTGSDSRSRAHQRGVPLR